MLSRPCFFGFGGNKKVFLEFKKGKGKAVVKKEARVVRDGVGKHVHGGRE
jgi:hypothetical protein